MYDEQEYSLSSKWFRSTKLWTENSESTGDGFCSAATSVSAGFSLVLSGCKGRRRIISHRQYICPWKLVFLDGGDSIETGCIDNLSIEGQFCNLAIQTAGNSVHQTTDLVEASSKEQLMIVIGQHVSKRFAELTYEGVVESHDNASEMFKVVYTNGDSEEMRWEDLMKYLVPHKQPLPPFTNELANNVLRDHETDEGLAQVAPAPTHKCGHTKKMSSRTKRKEGANNICPPRQAGPRGPRRSTRNDETLEMVKPRRSARKDETSGMMKLRHSTRKSETSEVMKLRRSTRKRKELGYSYCEETTDEDEYEYENDEPNYPLPPIIQVPWADGGDESPERVPTRGLCTSQGRRGRAKRHWVSLRISASSYHRNGHKRASDGSEGLGD